MSELFAKPPGAKIGYGLLFTILVITAPIGLPLLITGVVQLFSKRWRARGLIARAAKSTSPEDAKALLDQANAMLPSDPEVLAPLAAWHADQQDFAAATQLYEKYLSIAQGDYVARGQYARCLLLIGESDRAIAEFLPIRALPLDVESQASITTFLAIAHLMKSDTAQALAILKEAPLQKRSLGPGLQQCLQYRAIAQYLLGNTTRAIADMDRLYAVNPAYPQVEEDKAAMQRGSFVLESPAGPISREGIGRKGASNPIDHLPVANPGE